MFRFLNEIKNLVNFISILKQTTKYIETPEKNYEIVRNHNSSNKEILIINS